MQRIAVMGAGAVGCYFGGMLARAGADVTLIARGAHLEALARNGLFLDTLQFKERVPVRASGDAAAVRGAELVLLSVKTTGTEDAARAIAPHLDSGALVMSLQNGVDNLERIRAASGIEAFASVVYVAASIPEPGRVLHGGRGDLTLGDARAREVAAIAATFERAGITCRITDNIQGEVWQKFLLNCAGNAVTALSRANYAQLVRHPPACKVVEAALEEARSVGKAAGVRFPEPTLSAKEVLEIYAKYGDSTSSTAQDVARGRRTEIDSFNGYVARRGAELGVDAPVNHTLYALIKLWEQTL
jgi:2-dehydropantoate 2-reductase